jgi:hypothetical protein
MSDNPFPLGKPVNRPPRLADVRVPRRPGWWRRPDGSVYYREPTDPPPAGTIPARRTP